MRCAYVPKDFHARYSAKGKVYRYRIWSAPILPPLEFERAWHIVAPLDFHLLKAAARKFVGKHDFAAFAANRGKPETDTVRTIHSVRVRKERTLRDDRLRWRWISLQDGSPDGGRDCAMRAGKAGRGRPVETSPFWTAFRPPLYRSGRRIISSASAVLSLLYSASRIEGFRVVLDWQKTCFSRNYNEPARYWIQTTSPVTNSKAKGEVFAAFFRRGTAWLFSQKHFHFKLLSGTAAGVIVIIFLAGVFLYITLRNHYQAAVRAHTIEVMRLSSVIENDIAALESGHRGFLLTGKPAYIDSFDRRKELIKHRVEDLTALILENPKQRKRVMKVQEVVQKWLQTVALPEIKSPRSKNAAVAATDDPQRPNSVPLGNSLLNQAREILQSLARRRADRSQPAHARTRMGHTIDPDSGFFAEARALRPRDAKGKARLSPHRRCRVRRSLQTRRGRFLYLQWILVDLSSHLAGASRIARRHPVRCGAVDQYLCGAGNGSEAHRERHI